MFSTGTMLLGLALALMGIGTTGLLLLAAYHAVSYIEFLRYARHVQQAKYHTQMAKYHAYKAGLDS